MLDITFIRQQPSEVRAGLLKRGITFEVDEFLSLDAKARNTLHVLESLRNAQKDLGKRIRGESEELTRLKGEVQARTKEHDALAHNLKEWLKKLPNLPLSSVPQGKSEADNVVMREVGTKRVFPHQPKDYFTIAKGLDLIDTERAGKVSGSRFGYLKGDAARLEMALIAFAFDRIAHKGFTPIIPPVLIKNEMMDGTGYIDSEQDRDERYHLEKDALYLVGTSEQSIVPMHANEIFREEDLPRRYIGFSTCFRREAGSYGKDTKGIIRVHQFDKVEMVFYSTPEMSETNHALLLAIEEELMQALAIPYRVIALSTGDLSAPSAATYDIEAWFPGQNEGRGQYRETHSTSNTTDFQARRLDVKYRTSQGTTRFVHIGNGTAFAIGRTIAAIIENYQTQKGGILIPDVLHPYIPHREINPR